MSIISELNKTKDYLRSSRNAVLARGGEISPTAGLKDLPNAIYNIPADSSLAFPSDDTVAYRKIVPVGAEQMARVTTLGGMTYKCKNLFDLAKAEFKKSGSNNFSWEVVDNKLKLISKLATETSWNHVYTVLNIDLSSISQLYISSTANPYNFTTSIMILRIFEKETGTRVVNNEVRGTGKQSLTISQTIPAEYRNKNYEARLFFYGTAGEASENDGYIEYSDIMVATEETPYEPYFEGLRSAKVTSLKSEGANLIPFPYRINTATEIGLTADVNSDGSIRLHGTATEVGRFNEYFLNATPLFIPKGTTLSWAKMEGSTYDTFLWRFALHTKDKQSIASIDSPYTRTITLEDDCAYVYLDINYWTTAVGEEVDITFYPMLNYGSTAAPFTPYRAEPIDTLALPEWAQSLPDWGEGVSADYNNRIKFAEKKYRQEVEKVVFNGTEGWYQPSVAETSYFQVGIVKKPKGSNVGVVNDYNYANVGSTGDSIGWLLLESGYLRVRPDLTLYPDVASWTAHLAKLAASGNPFTLVYALAEPIETDISAYLTSDGFFKVQGGGTVVAENEYEYAVPSKINYVQKVGI